LDLRGCPSEKIPTRAIRNKKSKLYIVGKLNKCRFRKKYELPVGCIPQKEIANNHCRLARVFANNVVICASFVQGTLAMRDGTDGCAGVCCSLPAHSTWHKSEKKKGWAAFFE